jgi:hypothetical protein
MKPTKSECRFIRRELITDYLRKGLNLASIKDRVRVMEINYYGRELSVYKVQS